MNKDNEPVKDELRAEYKRSDFPGGLLRGKYAERCDRLRILLFSDPKLLRPSLMRRR